MSYIYALLFWIFFFSFSFSIWLLAYDIFSILRGSSLVKEFSNFWEKISVSSMSCVITKSSLNCRDFSVSYSICLCKFWLSSHEEGTFKFSSLLAISRSFSEAGESCCTKLGFLNCGKKSIDGLERWERVEVFWKFNYSWIMHSLAIFLSSL